jgi:cyclopropane-fatty-acyl-phospholipid synthase
MSRGDAFAIHDGCRELGLMDRLTRGLLLRKLDAFRDGEIRIEEPYGATQLGERGELHATVRVHVPRFYRRLVLGGSLGAAESYKCGDWDCDNLTDLFRLFVRNRNAAQKLEGWCSQAVRWTKRLTHRWRANTRTGSRRNIRAHYDLGNDFFQLWLDKTWAYSCGVFASAETTLHEASVEKFDRACRKLDLHSSDHLLEIGTGWGGLALHAAEHYGCRVTTTTISDQQYELARRRIDAAGLAGRITLLRDDYRSLQGRFDKLVSIEMIEAVGHEYLDTFFRKCSELLKPEGSLLIQAIVMPERNYRDYLHSVDFIRHYIFPGGCLPSVGAMLESIGRVSEMRLVHVEDFSPHYAETLRRWRQAFQEQVAEVRQRGYSQELVRLWNYYLCYCEAAFEERHVGVVQIQCDQAGCHRDPVDISTRAAQAPRVASERISSLAAQPACEYSA